jgi:hypothetical protein
VNHDMPDVSLGMQLIAFVVPTVAAFLVAGCGVTVALQVIVAKWFKLGPVGTRAVFLANVVTSPTLVLLSWFAVSASEILGVGLPWRLTMQAVLQAVVIWIHGSLYTRSLGTDSMDARGWLRFAAAANGVSAAPGFVAYVLLADDHVRRWLWEYVVPF